MSEGAMIRRNELVKEWWTLWVHSFLRKREQLLQGYQRIMLNDFLYR